ncbi:MAG: hypothetical protein Q8O98_02365 [bacterium]|nr:hypothetical protein [bacterium]
MPQISPLFGSDAKVKIMRLFIFNPQTAFSPKDVSKRAKERPDVARREIRNLSKAGLIKRRAKGLSLNASYPYLDALRDFLIDATPITTREIIKKINKAGSIKLILISGVFKHDPESRVDFLVVGDHLKQGTLVSAISSIEAELGKELRYAAFETPDFKYRLSIYDKLIRDILDYPHEKILNKLGI